VKFRFASSRYGRWDLFFGLRGLLSAHSGTAAMARTPVLPRAIP